MKNVIIIGNSGAARECFELFYSIYFQSNAFRQDYLFKGFLRHGDYEGCLDELKYLELGSDNDYIIQENDVFVIAIGDNILRMNIYQNFKEKGANFINLVSPFAYVAAGVTMGEGNIITIGCHLAHGVKLGDCNYLNGDIRISHHVQIGTGNFFGPRSMVMGNVIIGDINGIGPTAVLLEKSKIGSYNKIAPGAIVYKGCKDNCIMSGNPALIIKE